MTSLFPKGDSSRSLRSRSFRICYLFRDTLTSSRRVIAAVYFHFSLLRGARGDLHGVVIVAVPCSSAEVTAMFVLPFLVAATR